MSPKGIMRKFNRIKKRATYVVLMSPFVALSAKEEFTQLTDSATGAKDIVTAVISSLLWVASLLPIGLGLFAAMKMKEHLEQKEEQNQHEPKWIKQSKIVIAFGGGVMMTFFLFGIFGKTFLDKSFTDTWDILVIQFWKDAMPTP